MHTQNRLISKKFLIPFTCLNREVKKWGYFEKKIKSPFTCLKWETILRGVFEKILKKQKTPPDSSNREEKVGEKILNCYIKEASRPFVYPHWANGIYWAILDPTNAH